MSMSSQPPKPKIKIAYIDRKYWRKGFFALSIEKIFSQIERLLDKDRYDVSTVKLPFGNSALDLLLNLIMFRRPNADIYHVTGQIHYIALVLPLDRTVLTIHDLVFLQGSINGLKKLVLKKLFLDWPVNRLKWITAVSETTKQEIISKTKCPPDKIKVIEDPVQDHFLNAERKEFNGSYPMVLHVGITPNKNITRLIEALSGIKCRLKIVGNMTDEIRSALGSTDIDHEIVSELSDQDMRDAYQTADMVAFCSTYEGFGLPIIEAQSIGVPVVTSNLSPMKDVSGGAAALVDPFDVESIRQGILRVINDDEFRNKIVNEGFANAKRFAPQRIAKQYQELYDEMLKAL